MAAVPMDLGAMVPGAVIDDPDVPAVEETCGPIDEVEPAGAHHCFFSDSEVGSKRGDATRRGRPLDQHESVLLQGDEELHGTVWSAPHSVERQVVEKLVG